jgi:phage regulator Rha-like protein
MTEIATVKEIKTVSMTTVEIAKQTGKAHKHVLTDTRNLFKSLEIDGTVFRHISKDSYGRDQKCYRLPKREVLILVSGYSIKLRAAIIDKLEELEKGLQVVSYSNAPSDILADELKARTLFNVPEHIAQIESVKQTKARCGVDFSQALISAPAQNNIKKTEVMLEPTELGKHFGISAIKMNRELERLGLQVKTANCWEPTEKGSKVSDKHSWASGAKSGYNYKWNLSGVKGMVK